MSGANRFRAPRRQVLRWERTGNSYGTTWWNHHLECGHIERRKRHSPTAMIGCLACAANQILDQPNIDATDLWATVELAGAHLVAELASALRVPPDAIRPDIRMSAGNPVLYGAVVTLGADDLKYLLNKEHH